MIPNPLAMLWAMFRGRYPHTVALCIHALVFVVAYLAGRLLWWWLR